MQKPFKMLLILHWSI